MSNKLATVLLILLSIYVLASCTRMQSEHYVGTKEPLFKELLKFKDARQVSVWKFKDDVFYVKPLDEYSAIASTLKWDQSQDAFKIINKQLVVTKIDDHMFLNLKEDGLYTILRIAYALASSDDQLVLFSVKEDKLKEDIQTGKIKIKMSTDKDTYILDVTKKKLDTYISKNINNLFDFNAAGIITLLVEPPESLDQDEPSTHSSEKKVVGN